MNIEKGLTRIYIVLSVLWAIFCLFVSFSIAFSISDIQGFLISVVCGFFIGIILPIIIYKIIKWIVNGFKEE